MGSNTRAAHFEPTERDESRDFGNEQDMSVDAKEHPALGPTEEAQDVDRLQKQVVPMPAFNDPNNPVAASGSVNLSLNDHPVAHSEDYGVTVASEFGFDHVENTMSEGARDLQEYDRTSGDDDPETAAAKNKAAGLPKDRDEWTKADWQTHAKSLGLATSGNKEALRARVEDHEGAQEERAEFDKETRSLSREDLDKAAAKYDINPEEYSTKDLLADAVVAAEFGEDVPAGDKTPSEDQ
jgi:hypothetical protein